MSLGRGRACRLTWVARFLRIGRQAHRKSDRTAAGVRGNASAKGALLDHSAIRRGRRGEAAAWGALSRALTLRAGGTIPRSGYGWARASRSGTASTGWSTHLGDPHTGRLRGDSAPADVGENPLPCALPGHARHSTPTLLKVAHIARSAIHVTFDHPSSRTTLEAKLSTEVAEYLLHCWRQDL